MTAVRWVLLATAMALTACTGDKQPAEEALKAARTVIEGVREEAIRYDAEALKRMDEAIKVAQDHFDNKRYTEALAAAKDLPAKSEEMAAAVAHRKTELARTFEDINISLPGLLTRIGARFDALGNEVPEGLDAMKLDEYRANFGELGKALQDAVVAEQAGDIPKAVDIASTAQAKATEIAQAIGASVAQ